MKHLQKFNEDNSSVTITQEEKDIFEYLNELRDSGVTNMFGATSYIVDEFDIDKRKASTILSKWMSNFNEDGYDHLTIEG